MAAGDITQFDQGILALHQASWDSTDTIKLALITSATVPTQTDDPCTLATYAEVTPGGNYAAGGATLGTLAAITSLAAGRVTMDAANVTISSDASNPTNARYGIIYNADRSDHGMFWFDLGSALDLTAADLNLNFAAAGFYYTE